MTALNRIQSKPVFKLDQPDDSYKFLPLPAPAGEYPYHLPIEKILPGISESKIIFHVRGDTGSVRAPDTIGRVAAEMTRQYDSLSTDQPQFLYHLGDIV